MPHWCKLAECRIIARWLQRQSAEDLFKGRQFDQEIIVLCVRWYLRYKLSARDLVEMMEERGAVLVHTTISDQAASTAFQSFGGTILSIRKFRAAFFTAEEMVRIGSVSSEVLACLRTAVETHQTILISISSST